MLVLSRKMGQSIQIGPNISITITRIRGERVQLGIQAPEDVPVIRSELLETHEAVRDEQSASVASTSQNRQRVAKARQEQPTTKEPQAQTLPPVVFPEIPEVPLNPCQCPQ